jgi:phage FluMu gp28-like protein
MDYLESACKVQAVLPTEPGGGTLSWATRIFSVGVDIGRVNDPTAIVALELIGLSALHVAKCERLPLGMQFAQQVAEVQRVLASHALRSATYGVTVDATGVGAPVVEMMRAAGVQGMLALSICSGAGDVRRGTVGKGDLITGAQIAIQSGAVKANPKMAGVADLLGELRNYRVKQNTNTGNLSWNAREGEHDDLVLALCLAVYRAKLMRATPILRLPREA